MSKIYIPALNYMRGLCMLGVIGIHIGSYALNNPNANPHLIALLEILTRFCVPAFFFLSAFGLFLSNPLQSSFSYKEFIKKRLQVVLLPYLTWSLIYTLYVAITSHTITVFASLPLALIFGNTAYHLYFMIILLWFYLLMPLWRYMTRIIQKKPLLIMSILFILQTAFNYLSSYHGTLIHFENTWLQYAYEQRLNYWVAHYIWIFLLGALMAERFDNIMTHLHHYRLTLTIAFSFSILTMLGSYYYVLDQWHYTLLEAIYTIHQLSPMGMLYTACGCLFFFYVFTVTPLTSLGESACTLLGNASYGMYLSHPLILFLLTSMITHYSLLYTSKVVILLYITATCLAFLLTQFISKTDSLTKIRFFLLGH